MSYLLNLCYENVVQLYVPMNDLLFLEEIKRQEDLLHDCSSRVFWDVICIFNHVEQCTFWLILKDQIYVIGVLENLKESQHVLALIERPMNLNFINQILESCFLFNNPRLV